MWYEVAEYSPSKHNGGQRKPPCPAPGHLQWDGAGCKSLDEWPQAVLSAQTSALHLSQHFQTRLPSLAICCHYCTSVRSRFPWGWSRLSERIPPLPREAARLSNSSNKPALKWTNVVLIWSVLRHLTVSFSAKYTVFLFTEFICHLPVSAHLHSLLLHDVCNEFSFVRCRAISQSSRKFCFLFPHPITQKQRL